MIDHELLMKDREWMKLSFLKLEDEGNEFGDEGLKMLVFRRGIVSQTVNLFSSDRIPSRPVS